MERIVNYRSALVTTLAAFLLVALLGAPVQAQRRATEVNGEFVQLPPVVTSGDPTTGRFTAVGIATVTGDWTGYWYEQLDVTFDPITGDATGTVLQTFTGSAADGTSGSLVVLEYFTLDGSTHEIHGEGKILEGSGDWEGSRGHYTADGINVGAGYGTWSAHWVRPSN